MAASLIHKVVKGDTLDAIAKKYKSDAKAIWKFADNKAVVSKRGKPESIQPGDSIVIPPSDKDLKEQAKKLEDLRLAREFNADLRRVFEGESKRNQRRLAIYNELIASNRDGTAEIVRQLEGNLRDMKGWADGVDAAALIATIAVSITKIASLGAKSAQATGTALEAINKEAQKELIGMTKAPFEDAGVKAASKLKDSAASPVGYVGVMADSWSRMTSPSFWAYAAVKKIEGKSWSEAASADIGDEIEARIREVQAQGQEQEAKLRENIRRVMEADKETQASLRECDMRIGFYEKEAAKLG